MPKNVDLLFYSTGYTVLAENFFYHRYSNVINLFPNENMQFTDDTAMIVSEIKKNSFTI